MHIHPSSPESSLFLDSEESAAIKIQAGFRGYRVRKSLQHQQQQSRKTKLNGYNKRPQHKTCQRVLAMMENNQNQTNAPNSSGDSSNNSSDFTVEADEVQQKCATKIQAGVRGFLVRKKQKIAADAATKIQAGFRGFKARKDVQKLKQK